MYAVIETQWHQYIVQEWSEIVLDRFPDLKEWDTVEIDNVYCLFDEDGKNVSVGAPTLAWAKVTASVVANQRGDKIRVMKFQSKKRYQRVFWHRSYQTILKIEKISG